MQNILPTLLPGDHLLYFDNSLVDWVIAVKTWKRIGHIEIYAGNGQSTASRNGIGVDRYPVRLSGLQYVLRPKSVFDFLAADHWFEADAKGNGYDFQGLMCFTLAVARGANGKQFCSEYARNWDRSAGIASFHEEWPGDLVAPGDYLASPAFNHIWRAN